MTTPNAALLATSSDTLTLNAYLEYISEQTERCVILNGKSYIGKISLSDVNPDDISMENIERILRRFDIGVHTPREIIKYKNYLLLYKLYSDSNDIPEISCEELKLCVKKIDQAVYELFACGIKVSLNKAECPGWNSYNLGKEFPVAELDPTLRASLLTVLAARSCGPINELKGISTRFNAALAEEIGETPEYAPAPAPTRKSAQMQVHTLEQLWPRLFSSNFFQFSPYLGRRAMTVIGKPQSSESLFRAIAEIQDLMISSLDGSRSTLVLRVPKLTLELSKLKAQLLEFIPGPCRDAIHLTQNNSLQYPDNGYSEAAISEALSHIQKGEMDKPRGRDIATYYQFITHILQRIQSLQVPTEALLLRFDEALISGERDSTGATPVLKLRVRLPGENLYTRLTVSEKRPRPKAIPTATSTAS